MSATRRPGWQQVGARKIAMPPCVRHPWGKRPKRVLAGWMGVVMRLSRTPKRNKDVPVRGGSLLQVWQTSPMSRGDRSGARAERQRIPGQPSLDSAVRIETPIEEQPPGGLVRGLHRGQCENFKVVLTYRCSRAGPCSPDENKGGPVCLATTPVALWCLDGS